MSMRRTSWLVVLVGALSGVAMASCTLLAPTGSNVSPDAFPTPDANGLVSIVHRRVNADTVRYSFEIQVQEGSTATPPAAIVIDDSVNEDIIASFRVAPLGLDPGVHSVFIFEGDVEDPTAQRVFVVPAPDAAASP